MKCAICHHEFGAGEVCQSCGADKFVGLGHYTGYQTPDSLQTPSSPNAPHPMPASAMPANMTACYACGEIIPAESKFCPYCSQKLWTECPKCGKVYSSQYPVCSECGTHRENYLAEIERQEQEKKRKEEEERRKHEEWLNSPEGQAELKRIKQEEAKKEAEKEAEQIRCKIKAEDDIMYGAISLTILVFVLVLASIMFYLPWVQYILMVFIITGFVFFKADSRIKKRLLEKRIENWKRKHPNHRATPYL